MHITSSQRAEHDGTASDDALILAAAEHIANFRAANAGNVPENDPRWAAYDRTLRVLDTTSPTTLAGATAKARAAIVEAGDDPDDDWDGVAARWSSDLTRFLAAHSPQAGGAADPIAVLAQEYFALKDQAAAHVARHKLGDKAAFTQCDKVVWPARDRVIEALIDTPAVGAEAVRLKCQVALDWLQHISGLMTRASGDNWERPSHDRLAIAALQSVVGVSTVHVPRSELLEQSTGG
jgi:hypothetical protein